MSKLISSALLVGCLALTTGCPSTDGPGVETGQFGVTVTWADEFGGANTVDCTTIELVVVSSAGDVFRDPGNCVDYVWDTGLLPLEGYAAQVNVYDVNGQLSAQSSIADQSLDVDGELVELAFTIVEDAGNFALSWTFVDEGTDDPRTCADTAVAEVVLETTLVSDSSAWDVTFPCRDGSSIEVGPYVPLGDYTIVTALLDSGGTEINASVEEAFSITHGGHVNDLGDFVFEFVAQ